jgi:hypothetical protein
MSDRTLADEQKVIARVRFRATAVYDRNIEMTRAKWDEWNKRLDKAEQLGGSALQRFHDRMFDELGFKIGEPEEYEDPELDTLDEVTPDPDEPEEPAAHGFMR